MSSFGYRAVVAGVLLATGVALFSLAASDPPQPPPNPQNLPNLPSARAEPAEPGPRAGPSWVAGPGFSNRGRVTALAVGAEIVAVGDDQGHLLFWNVKTGKRVETLHQGSDGGEQETIDDLAISRDGKQFSYILNRGGGMHQASVQAKGRDYSGFAISGKWAYYGATGDSRHWLGRETAKRELLLLTNNHAQGKFEEAVVSRFPHPDKVTHAAGDAGIVASVSGLEKATLRGWQAGNEKALWEVDLGGADVTGVLVSPGGKRVAVTGDAGLVRVFDAATGKPVSKAGGLTGTISAAAFDRDGKWLVVGCRDGAARVVDAESGEVLTTLRGHEDRVLAVAVGPDGTIATGAADKLVKVWQPRK